LKRTVILGLDGLSWSYIYLNRSNFQFFRKLIDENKLRCCHSVNPALTAPAWISAFTGKYPNEHGILDFWKPDKSFYTFRDSRYVLLYEYLSKYFRVSCVNVPLTFPAGRVSGEMISGLLCLDNNNPQRYHPPKLKDEFLQAFPDYIVDFNCQVDLKKLTTDKNEYQKAQDILIRITNLRFEVFKWFEKRKWDVLFIVFTSPDRVGHYFWNDKVYLYKYYKLIETIVKYIYENYKMIFLSDHGFQGIDILTKYDRFENKYDFIQGGHDYYGVIGGNFRFPNKAVIELVDVYQIVCDNLNVPFEIKKRISKDERYFNQETYDMLKGLGYA